MNSILNYLKNPAYTPNKKPRIIYFIFLFLVYIVLTVSIALVALIICKVFHITHNEIRFTPLKTILIVVILAPIYEEIIFRSLLKFKKSNIILFILTVIALIVYSVFKSKIIFVSICLNFTV